jgi:peptidoglycan/LPS O-acetylase OafA/YrhL
MGTDTRLDSIVYGCALSLIFRRAERLDGSLAERFLSALQGYRGAAVAAVIMALSFFPRSEEYKETFIYTVQGLSLTALFVSLFWRAPASAVKSAIEYRPLVFIGAISYSLYLYHCLALIVSDVLIENPFMHDAMAWGLSFAGAVMSYYWVEGPMRRFRWKSNAHLQVIGVK